MHNAVSILTPKRGRPSLHSFSIRDLFWLTAVVALAVGWWVERSNLNSTVTQLNGKLFAAEFRLVPLEAFTQGADRIEEIKLAAVKSPPPPEAAIEILHYVRHEKDYRIRIRAMDVFPHLAERTDAINVLRECCGTKMSSGVRKG